ncbi:hypothetical protein [Clostridium beijerinckii]|uniref:hypothetical protein n=1 Tax=Clostridium beijerinckii TaxID=1520 RepID=UPI00098CA2D8|nr:hypothetical protein [Clostridium beijerinckii]MBA8937214.1 hypothetical protein [Clostridium beijerinckii]NRU40320.1 hypothetical protein [Clostridium beijerinckii]NSA96403.1 hypothetical protein [Clostridium beijerinckii]OOM66034.1 hypothetical protein CLOBI_08740 [Clostridium beijerinckii]OOM72069.1 hypothetical protein CLBEIC_08140 [Clostridium beijerinckii]
MKKWKTVLISYIDYCNNNYFIENRLRDLTFPLNFNNFYYSKLSRKSQIGVKSIEKNTLELILIYYKIHKLYGKYKKKDTSKYRYILKTELEHFILRYRLVVDKLELLKKDFDDLKINWSNVDYFTQSEEYNQLLKIRNDIAHESIRSHVFCSDILQREAFQFYTNRNLDNNIYLHEVFLNPNGTEIYDLKRWLTWMLVLIYNFMDDIMKDITNAITNKYDMDSKKINQIKQYDILVNNKSSTVPIIDDEIIIFKNGMYELIKHIKEYKNY